MMNNIAAVDCSDRSTTSLPPTRWCTVARPYAVSPGDSVWIRKQQVCGRVVESVSPFRWSVVPTIPSSDTAPVTLHQRDFIPAPWYDRDAQNDEEVVVVVTPDTGVFRLLADVPVLPSTSSCGVLEIGSSTGKTSVVLWRHCTSWLGWDSGTEMVQIVQALMDAEDDQNSSRARHRIVARVNLLEEPTLAANMLHNQFGEGECGDDTTRCILRYIFIDIGGDRCCTDVLAVLQWVLLQGAHCWKGRAPPTIVIKNEALHAQLGNEHDPSAWFVSEAAKAAAAAAFKMPSHPLQAKRQTVPGTDLSICRYHNYHTDGCKKTLDDSCPFDHLHCHWCRQPGHRAVHCPAATTTTNRIA